jgi:hypothetical protein
VSQQYVGIDLHRRRSVIVRTDVHGEVLREVRIENDPLALAAEIAKAGPASEVALEATYPRFTRASVGSFLKCSTFHEATDKALAIRTVLSRAHRGRTLSVRSASN